MSISIRDEPRKVLLADSPCICGNDRLWKRLYTTDGKEMIVGEAAYIGTISYVCSQCWAVRLRLRGTMIPPGQHKDRISSPKEEKPRSPAEGMA